MPARILGLYSLACMEREGSTYGYRVSQRIAESTEGAWRPGAGAVYPALKTLVERGLAVHVRQGRRQVYRITPRGRAVLRRLRRGPERRASAPDLSALWAEVVGLPDLPSLLLRRLSRSTGAVEALLRRTPLPRAELQRIRAEALRALDEGRRRLISIPIRSRGGG